MTEEQRKRQAKLDRLLKRRTELPTDDGPVHIEVASMIASRSKEGAVELKVGDTRVQMDITKAREVLDMLSSAIEAAVSDELFFKLLTGKLGLGEGAAAMALLDLRELRQGSKGTVYPT